MRDRATNPRFGDQTACKFCGLDIEYHGKKVGWIDRGGNSRCQDELLPGEPVNESCRKHQPVSDR